MKKVLIADSHPLFRDFLKQKLTEEQIEVITAQQNRDLFTKMITALPNLIILDMNDDDTEEMDFLEEKSHDTNASQIPVIITGPKRDRSSIAAMAKYGVIKYFEKPVQFDLLLKSIGSVVHTPLSMDTTPCVLDLHRNNNIIFVELAQGLNREKIALLQFKLAEMIEKENIDTPKVIIMLTNLELTFVDGYNLEFLIDNVLAAPKIHNKNVKILSLSPFVRELLDGHSNYSGIEISNNLPKLLTSLVDTTVVSDVTDLITNKILTPSYEAEEDNGSMATRFAADAVNKTMLKANGTVLVVAIVDSDEANAELSRKAFEAAGATCMTFTSGSEFLKFYTDDKFDLIILDILIADKTGLSLLQTLQKKPHAPPVIVYSASSQRELIVKTLASGAKTYIVKPQKPGTLVQKSLAVLRGTEN